ncbi:tyrosine-type recombinase/integrase [Succinivibrio dextrinosolvens]|nr:tyrosine-type recombinase/integrase [Succinivibrio dextrinosolvens]
MQKWISQLKGKTSTIANKVITVRNFLVYLNTIHNENLNFLPITPKVHDDYQPFIFTDEQLKSFLEYVDSLPHYVKLKNPKTQIGYCMLLRLIIGCGLRIGETLKLRVKDVDFINAILTMRFAKNNKQRFVPMHESLNQMLKSYCIALGIINSPGSLLFWDHSKGTPLPPQKIGGYLRKLLIQFGLRTRDKKDHERGVCIHILRHYFAFKSFKQAQLAGRNFNDSVPFLSVYLGHESFKETEKYLKFTSEMYPEAIESFNDYTSQLFPEVIFYD